MDGWLLHVMGLTGLLLTAEVYALGHWFAVPSRLAVVAELERYLYFFFIISKSKYLVFSLEE